MTLNDSSSRPLGGFDRMDFIRQSRKGSRGYEVIEGRPIVEAP